MFDRINKLARKLDEKIVEGANFVKEKVTDMTHQIQHDNSAESRPQKSYEYDGQNRCTLNNTTILKEWCGVLNNMPLPVPHNVASTLPQPPQYIIDQITASVNYTVIRGAVLDDQQKNQLIRILIMICGANNKPYLKGMNILGGYLTLFRGSDDMIYTILYHLMYTPLYHFDLFFTYGLQDYKKLINEIYKCIELNGSGITQCIKDYDVMHNIFVPLWANMWTNTPLLSDNELLYLWNQFINYGWKSVIKLSVSVLLCHQTTISTLQGVPLIDYLNNTFRAQNTKYDFFKRYNDVKLTENFEKMSYSLFDRIY